ncbi:MAG TPA: NAD(P)-binding protein [Actinomycetota bacterium]|nr:NAD(P)-binding protein [Actinomycetota bacterium]
MVTRQHLIDGSEYPPAATGFRGSHPGSFEVAHALRDGERFGIDGLTDADTVDLVIVGAGISGLAAAWFYRREHPDASILLLDNHDDFGGHAKRNEFTVDGRFLLGYGGSEALQSPEALYGPEAKGMLATLGVDHHRFDRYFDTDLYPSLGLSRGQFFTKEAFGEDKLVAGDPMRMVADDIPIDRMHERAAEDFIADFPLPEASRRALVELYTSDRDPLPSLDADAKHDVLLGISYREYIQRYWGLDDLSADTFQGRSLDFYAIGVDGVTAFDAMETGYPGFAGMRLASDPRALAEMEEPYIYHFPDGNASIARLIVRSLIPSVAPGSTMEDVVTARFDYRALDRPEQLVRLRLGSTAVRVANDGDGVRVAYVRDGERSSVRAQHAIVAGYHMMIARIMPELPRDQRRALRGNIKAPLSYTKVVVRNWRPWVACGVHEITNPMGFFSRLKLDYPVSIGDYRFPSSPDEPMVLHLVHVPTVPGPDLPRREQNRQARQLLYDTTFEDFEFHVRDELGRMLGAGGFDPDSDIAAITVNRWGHGYSYAGDPLHAPDEDAAKPYELARTRCGNVAFANADAGWMPLASEAIAQAHRAVGDLSSG